MRPAARSVALGLLVAASTPIVQPGCGQGGATNEKGVEAGRPIEMFSWLERIGDSDPLGALAAQHRLRNPEDTILNARANLSGQARRALRNRMMAGEPPDTFQANAGSDLMQWVVTNGTDAHESKLMPLDDLLSDVAAWRQALPPRLLLRISHDGKIYGVPANLHRNNSVFYSKKVFERYGLTEPKTIDDLFSLGNKLRGSGVSLLALGSREPWTVSLLLFEGLLVAREGPEVYRDYFMGRLAADDSRIVRTIEAGLKLFAFANPDHKALSWLQAVELVAQGKAAMTVMGDWARGPFEAQGLKLGVDYGQIPFPDAADTFVFSSDTFALPAGAKNRLGAQRFLETIISPDGQRVISRERGTLSARLDVPPPESDPVRVANYALLKKGPVVVALSGMVPAAFGDDLNAALSEMIDQHDVDPVVHTLRSRYALLK